MKKIFSVFGLVILMSVVSGCQKRTQTPGEVLTMKDRIGNINEEKSDQEVVDELNEEYQELRSAREKDDAGVEKLDVQSSLMGNALDSKFKVSEIDETIDLLPQMKIKAGSFAHSGFNFKIDFPESWTTSRNVLGAVLMIMSPEENDEDDFQENISVVVENVPSLYANETAKTYTKQALVKLKENLKNFKLQYNESIKLHGEPAQALNYTLEKDSGEVLEISQVITIYDKRAYAITYTAKNNDFKKLLPIFKKSLKSFKFLSKTARK